MIIVGHTMGTPEYDLLDAVRLFARLGLEGVEVVYQEGYRCGLWEDRLELARELRRAAADAGLGVVALTPYYNAFNSLDDGERRAANDGMRRCLETAAALGAGFVRVYGGRFLAGEIDRDRKEGILLESLAELGDFAREHAVRLVVENHFNTLTDTAGNTARIISRLGHPAVGILYDQANLGFIGAEPAPEAVSLQLPWTYYVHVKDFVFTGPERAFRASRVDHVAEEERTVRSRIPGEGALEWPEILRRLSEGGYDGPLSLEYERRWHPDDLPPAEQGMARGAGYLRDILARLSRLQVG